MDPFRPRVPQIDYGVRIQPVYSAFPSFPPTRKPWFGIPAFCPGLDPIPLPGAQWHALNSAPAFTVCNKCFSTSIASSPFASHFKLVPPLDPTAPARVCFFQTPRAQRPWQQSLHAHAMEPFETYARVRAPIPPCPGEIGVPGASPLAPSQWFSIAPSASPKVDDFVVCSACYTDEIAGTSAEAYFAPHQDPQPIDARWTCDAANRRVRALLRALADGSSTWADFASAAQVRLHDTPPCPGAGIAVPAQSRAWFRPRDHPVQPGGPFSTVCEACHLDCIVASPALSNLRVNPASFVRVPDAEAQAPNAREWTCDAAVPAVRFALTHALYQPDPDPNPRHPLNTGFPPYGLPRPDPIPLPSIAQSADAVLQAALLPHGTCAAYPGTALPAGAQVWHFQPGFENADLGIDVDACVTCFAAYIAPLGFEARFRSMIVLSDGSRVCDFGAAESTSGEWTGNWAVGAVVGAYGMRNVDVFERAAVPVCPEANVEGAGGLKWFGDDGVICCPACYANVLRGTPFDAQLTLRGARIDSTTPPHCMLYSPRSRALLSTARRLPALAESLAERNRVHEEVIPRLREVILARRMHERAKALRLEAVQLGVLALKWAAGTVAGDGGGGAGGEGDYVGIAKAKEEEADTIEREVGVVEDGEEEILRARWREVE